MFELTKLLERLSGMVETGLLGTFGAIANWAYVSVTQPGRPMRFGLFACNVIVSFYVGNVVGAFIDETNVNRDGIILVCGFCAYPLLGLVEANFKTVAQSFVDRFRR